MRNIFCMLKNSGNEIKGNTSTLVAIFKIKRVSLIINVLK